MTAIEIATENFKKANDQFKIASQAYTEVQGNYRHRKIGDDEFTKGHKAFKEALAAWDQAEADINAAEEKASLEIKPEAKDDSQLGFNL